MDTHPNDDVVFEMELIKQVEINVDYILLLVEKYRAAKGDGTDMEVRAEIERAVDASPSLRNKKDLIEDFVDSVSNDGAVDAEWRRFVAARRRAELSPFVSPYSRGWEKLYVDHVLQADRGADLDFLVGSSGDGVPRVSH